MWLLEGVQTSEHAVPAASPPAPSALKDPAITKRVQSFSRIAYHIFGEAHTTGHPHQAPCSSSSGAMLSRPLTPFDAEETESLLPGAPRSIGSLEVDPLVALGIKIEMLVLVIVMTARLDEVNVCNAILTRSINLLSSAKLVGMCFQGSEDLHGNASSGGRLGNQISPGCYDLSVSNARLMRVTVM